MDSGRNLHLERSLLDSSTVPTAIGAGVLDLLPGAAASRTRLRSDELTERAPRDVLQAARAARPPTPNRSSPKKAANRSVRLPRSNCVGVNPPPRSPA